MSVNERAQGTRLLAHDARSQWMYLKVCLMCSATQAVKCGVVSSSPSSLASVLLSFRPTRTIFLHFHIVFLILFVVILCQFIQLFTRSHFSHMSSLYSHGILGVVFTHTVGYSTPPSAVNDPTVTKQVNSGKSCLEEVSRLGCPDQSVLGTSACAFRRNKESTMILASYTKTKNSFVSIVGFVDLLLLSFKCRNVDNACLKSDLCLIGIESESILFERIHQLLCNYQFLVESNGGYDLRPQDHPFGDKDLRSEQFQTYSCGICHLVQVDRGYPGSTSCISWRMQYS